VKPTVSDYTNQRANRLSDCDQSDAPKDERGLQRFEHSLMLNGLNVLNGWNYLNAQVDAEGNQK
jgi:hypothetical protein